MLRNSQIACECSRHLDLQGCSSDIPIHFYSLSTDLKSDWTCSHPFQPEIESYLQNLSQLYSLESHICFGTKVENAVWDPALHLYHVTTEDTRTGERKTTDAEVLVSAIGLLDIPKYPEIPGLATFRGRLFHSARWEKDFDFKGKRVAVIGNGSSAYVDLVVIRESNFEFGPSGHSLFPLSQRHLKFKSRSSAGRLIGFSRPFRTFTYTPL